MRNQELSANYVSAGGQKFWQGRQKNGRLQPVIWKNAAGFLAANVIGQLQRRKDRQEQPT